MRYHYKPDQMKYGRCGRIYICNHPVYDKCTLYDRGGKGLAIIQQRFNPKTKRTWWTHIDPWLVDEIYLAPGFQKIFEELAREPVDGLYPTMTVRQIMWALKMKPLKKDIWETVFDKKLYTL